MTSGDRLMVVTCDFTMAKEKGDDLLAFDIAPDSVRFHLFEAVERRTRGEAGRGLAGY